MPPACRGKPDAAKANGRRSDTSAASAAQGLRGGEGRSTIARCSSIEQVGLRIVVGGQSARRSRSGCAGSGIRARLHVVLPPPRSIQAKSGHVEARARWRARTAGSTSARSRALGHASGSGSKASHALVSGPGLQQGQHLPASPQSRYGATAPPGPRTQSVPGVEPHLPRAPARPATRDRHLVHAQAVPFGSRSLGEVLQCSSFQPGMRCQGTKHGGGAAGRWIPVRRGGSGGRDRIAGG